MKKVLFSTLGMTDPIKNDFDGPFLHIMRHNKPSRAYLFMTGRICELADQDDRYRFHAKQLCELERFDCELIELRYPDIENPQEFDIFYPIFEEILINIHKDNPGCQILVNLSSGTPQMKSSCNLIALTMPFPIIPIQVTTPNEKENYGSPGYDLKAAWSSNIDNHPDMEPKDRTVEVVSDNLTYQFFREAAISHIKAYDYAAAMDVLLMVKEFVPGKVIHLLKAARHRKNMELKEAKKESEKADYNLFPIQSGDALDIFEYLLLLRLQQESGQLMDFIRGVSPALTRLFLAFLKEKCQRDVTQEFCEADRYEPAHYILRREKIRARDAELLNFYDSIYPSGFRDSDLSCATLLPMILFDCRPEGRSSNSEAIKRVERLRLAEKKIRNPAAHNIVAIREDKFSMITGSSSKNILEDMQWMFKYSYAKYLGNNNSVWDSYNQMNEHIIGELKFG